MEPTFTVQKYGLILDWPTRTFGGAYGPSVQGAGEGALQLERKGSNWFFRRDNFIFGPGGTGEGKVALLEGFGLVGVADIQDELFFAIMELAGGI